MTAKPTAKTTVISNIRGKIVTIRHATETDLPFLEDQLKMRGLNAEDLHTSQFVVAAEESRIVGFGRLRKTGDVYDIVCVTAVEEHDNKGVTAAIVDHLIEYGDVKKAYVPLDLADIFKRRGFTQAKEPPAGFIATQCESAGTSGAILMVFSGAQSEG